MPQNFAQWNVGDVILDLYKVTDILGEGGFGKVYKVRHQGWNIDLAVKIPKPEIVAAAGGVANFEREAETWVKLGLHPHTVSCHYVRRIDESPVVFAEYVAGGSLHDWIYSRRLYAGGAIASLQRILDIAIQFAWGLHYAHEQGLIHQDVKPANVMMTAEGVVKVTDFGLANTLTAAAIANNQEGTPQASKVSDGTLMVPGSGAMTPAFCSPEQANGNNLTRRTDLWSWALSVLEMFQGELTWAHGTVAASALEYYLEGGSEYSQLPQMPILLAQLLRRCFRENPTVRPHDMLEVANELQSIYQQVIGEAYPQQQPQTGKDIADSLNNRAVSLFDLGREPEAFQLWEQVLQLQPHHPESTYNRGLIFWRAGRINDDTLVRDMEKVRQSYRGNWVVDYLLGLVHLERDDCNTAIEILEKISQERTQQQEVQKALALAQERLPKSKQLLRTFKGHTESITSVCLSMDNRFALSGSYDETVKLWEVTTGRCLRTFGGHMDRVESVSLSADSQFALSGSNDRTVKLWEVATGLCLRTFEEHTLGVCSVYLSRDNLFALSGSYDETVKLWEVATGRCLRTFEDGERRYVASSVYLSTDNRFALFGSSTLELWEVDTGRCLHNFEDRTTNFRETGVTSVCISADNKLALSGHNDHTLKLWEITTGRCLRTFEVHNGTVNSACISADNKLALSGGDHTLKLWEITTGRCLRTFEGHTSGVSSVCLSVDSGFALSGGWDNTLNFWTINYGTPHYLAPMVLSKVLTTEALLSINTTYKRRLEQAQAAINRQDYVAAAQYVRQARLQRGCEQSAEALKVWTSLYISLPRKAFLAGWKNTTLFIGHTSYVRSICLSADDQFALSGSDDGTLKLWEVATGQCLRNFVGHTSYIHSSFLSANNQFVLSTSYDKTLKLWKVSTGECLYTLELHEDVTSTICLSADFRFMLSGNSDDTLKLWEVATGQSLRTFKGHEGGVQSVCLSADNQFALSGGGNLLSMLGMLKSDTTIKLWEIATGRCLRIFEGHIGAVNSVCLSANNRFALSGSDDGTLKLWEVATGKCLRTFVQAFVQDSSSIKSVCLSLDDRFAFSASLNGTLKLWEVATGSCLYSFVGSPRYGHHICLSANNKFLLSNNDDNNLALLVLDWELEDRLPADWDEGARPYLENFLTLHTPYAANLLENSHPSEEEITLALTRRGLPSWTEEDFQNLLYTLGCAGYGWLCPEGVRHQLEVMATHWKRIIKKRKIYHTPLYLYFNKIFSIKKNAVKIFNNFLPNFRTIKKDAIWKNAIAISMLGLLKYISTNNSVLTLIHPPTVILFIFIFVVAFIAIYCFQEMIGKIRKK